MLSAFRNFGQTSTVKYGLILLALSFILWGVGDYLQGGQNNTAVKVGDEKITVNEIYSAYQSRKNQITQMTGQAVTDEIAAQIGLPQQILKNLIQEKLLLQAARDMGLAASEQQVAAEITSLAAFQSDDGVFDTEVYRRNLAASGLNARTFEESLMQDQKRRLVLNLFNIEPDKSWVKESARLAQSALDLDIVSVEASDLPVMAAPTDTELEEFYTARQAQYMLPERRTLHVLKLTQENFKSEMPTQEAIEAYYNNEQELFKEPERRRVQQIIAQDETEALVVREKLVAGEKLTAVNLGLVRRDDLPADFADNVFKLAVGDYSAPIETPLGFIVAWVTEVEAAAVKPLADVRADIVTTLKESDLYEQLESALTEIEDKSAGGMTMAEISAEMGVAMTAYPQVMLRDASLPRDVLNVAFELNTGDISEAIMDNDAYFFVELISDIPAMLPPLKENITKVTADFVTARDRARVTQAMTTVKNLVNDGKTSLREALNKANIKKKPIVLKGKKQTDLAEVGFSGDIFVSLLALKANETLGQTVRYKNVPSIVILRQRTLPKEISEIDMDNAKTALKSSLRNETLQYYLTALNESTPVKLYEGRLQQIFRSGSE